MTDLHLRILRAVAKRRQRRLEDHNTTEHAEGGVSAIDGGELQQAAGRADANVAAAEGRRRRPLPRRVR